MFIIPMIQMRNERKNVTMTALIFRMLSYSISTSNPNTAAPLLQYPAKKRKPFPIVFVFNFE